MGVVAFIRSTPEDDVRTGTAGNDDFHLWRGGNDTASGLAGNDVFRIGHALTAADHIDGGADFDTAVIRGDYSGGLTLGATTLENVERLRLREGSDYDLTVNDGNVAAGKTLWVTAKALNAPNFLTFDGSQETDGKFKIHGGGGDDTITGGEQKDKISGGGGDDSIKGSFGGDELSGGPGADTFVYGSVNESKSGAYDKISDFNAANDFFDMPPVIEFVMATNAFADEATLDANLAAAAGDSLSGAIVVTITSGDLTGHVYLLVNGDNTGFYNAGSDYLMEITGFTGPITTANFI